MSALVIVNRGSGSKETGKIVNDLKLQAAELGVQCEFVVVTTPKALYRAAQAAAASPHDTVVAGGGDGTINAIASQLTNTGKKLGVLPLGTFNYFARDLGVATDLRAAFRDCFDGDVQTLSIGEVNGRIFLNNASIGLYPLVLSIREQSYEKWGRRRLIAYWSVVKAILHPQINMTLRLTVDGETRRVRTPMLFAARNAAQLTEFQVPGLRCIDDEGLSIYLLKPVGKIKLLRLAARALLHKLKPFSDFDVFCAREILVESRRKVQPVAYDGESARMRTPLSFSIRTQALQVIAPRKQVSEVAA